MRPILLLILISSLWSCNAPSAPKTAPSTKNLSYLALGDSYTIGQDVAVEERWPNQLQKALLAKHKLLLDSPLIIAKTGWRTDNLLSAMAAQLTAQDKFDLVSILIGVNNQFQGRKIEQYEKDLAVLFEKAIALSRKGKEGVFVLSIPDYGVTPFGKEEEQRISKEIDAWNASCEKLCKEYGLAFYDITAISRKAAKEPNLLASDKLHPSGKMYQEWVDRVVDLVATKHLKK